jgi:hypothetical protein
MKDRNHHIHQHNNSSHTVDPDHTKHSLLDYIPLVVTLLFIGIATTTYVAVTSNSSQNWMIASMGYFFLFFSLFKLIDLPGFKAGFAHYDIIAKRVPKWGYVYPFIELTLGILFLLQSLSIFLYWVTVGITLLNVASVAVKLSKRERFVCACLGTILKVPLTTVTLLEYGTMGLMAIWLIAKAQGQ